MKSVVKAFGAILMLALLAFVLFPQIEVERLLPFLPEAQNVVAQEIIPTPTPPTSSPVNTVSPVTPDIPSFGVAGGPVELTIKLTGEEVDVFIGNAGPGFGEYSSASTSILALEIPKSQGFVFPCVNSAFSLTSRFGPRWGGVHKGTDLVCTGDSALQSVTDAVIWRVYSNLGYDPSLGGENSLTFDFDVSGRTYILATRVDKDMFSDEASNESGETVVVIIIYGHMSAPTADVPLAGSIVSQGTFLGDQGNTGYVIASSGDGTHLHLGVGIVLSDGRIIMVDPARLIPGL